MDITKLPAGTNAPWDVNVIIEIPQGGSNIKYEIDKDTGALMVDRFMNTAMFYPANYGFIPHTLADDGDPLDVLVVDHHPLLPGCVVAVRPIGVMHMEDEKGMDEKIIAVPIASLNGYYSKATNYKQLPEILCQQIEHFFKHYKDLDANKWVKISRWGDENEAAELILKTMIKK
jgi:inorganic pyrophosphatase